MSRPVWTAADAIRFEQSIARVKAARAREVDPWFDCAHCGDSFNRLFADALACPGCGQTVCRECHDGRRIYTAQSCRGERLR
jgi:Zn finger protein HypA/HybF involved in hydrogenase expression